MLRHYLRNVLRRTTKNVRFFELGTKEFRVPTDLEHIGARIMMSQLQDISLQIESFFSDTNPELEFLFDSLLLSLKTASKHAGSASISRALPSIKHAQNLSRLLERALLQLPIPSLHGHLGDLFEYFQGTLEQNSHVPANEELEELSQLTIELRKGITSLSDTKYIESHPDSNLGPKRNSSIL